MFWFAVGTTLAAFVLNRKETGKFIAIGQDWTEEQYAAYVKPSLERARGIRDPLMMCTKEGDGIALRFTP